MIFLSKNRALVIVSALFLSVVVILVIVLPKSDNSKTKLDLDKIDVVSTQNNTGWTKTQKHEKIKECIDEGLSLGTCECVVGILGVEFRTLADFDKQFDALATYLLEAFLTNDEVDISQIDSFADKIRQCP